ncbi:MAG: hypothetical protein KAH21_04030, partial [Spirochaetaceae bacterium]|nr:hypothetical protein [Spirochaetaceae bacterium]
MTSDENSLNGSPRSVVWYPCQDDNGLAESFGVPGFRGYLPFLLDQNDILEILLERLIRGFGWAGESEMIRDIAPYILGWFDGNVCADILEFLMMRIGEPALFVTWCALMWDLWLRDRDEAVLDKLL